MRYLSKVSVVTAIALMTLAGCGPTSSGNKVTKTIVDDPIVGLGYKCKPSAKDVIKHTTDEGNFTCETTDKVEFLIGNYSIGEVNVSAGTNTVMRIDDVTLHDANKTADIRRLLQTIDENSDKNKSVIKIPSNYSKLDDLKKKPGESGFEDAATAAIGKSLVSADEANNRADRYYLKSLLAGKTVYRVEMNPIRKNGQVVKKDGKPLYCGGEFEGTWKFNSGFESGKDKRGKDIKISFAQGYFVVSYYPGYSKFHKLDKITEDYIAFKEASMSSDTHKIEVRPYEKMVLYFDEAKAKKAEEEHEKCKNQYR